MKNKGPVFKKGDRAVVIKQVRKFKVGELCTIYETYEDVDGEDGFSWVEAVFDSKKENGPYLVKKENLAHATKSFTPDEKSENESIWDEFAD